MLNLSQLRRLTEGRGLQLHCTFCSSPQIWTSTEAVVLEDPSTSNPAKAKKILLVDDDDLVLKILQKVLASWDADIDVALNGKEALSRLSSRTYDLMICDVLMPEMGGQELFRHIQENALFPPERILFLTADKRTQSKEFLDSTGCYYLYKPIQFLELSEHVQAVLAGSSSS